MALEHDKLSKETAESFDSKIAKRIGELRGVAEALREWEQAPKGSND
jgi:peptide chain release factor 1